MRRSVPVKPESVAPVLLSRPLTHHTCQTGHSQDNQGHRKACFQTFFTLTSYSRPAATGSDYLRSCRRARHCQFWFTFVHILVHIVHNRVSSSRPESEKCVSVRLAPVCAGQVRSGDSRQSGQSAFDSGLIWVFFICVLLIHFCLLSRSLIADLCRWTLRLWTMVQIRD